MDIIGKTQYLKNMREELNSKKQLTQMYFIIFSLVLPQLFVNITQNNINTYQKFSILFLSLLFTCFLLIYYIEITRSGDLTEIDTTSVNNSAVFASIVFGFIVTIFLNISAHQIGLFESLGLNKYINPYFRFISLLLATTVIINMFLTTLLIKTKKEISVNESDNDIANEIIRLRSNPFMNMLRKKIGPAIVIMDLVYILLFYSVASYMSKFFFQF